MTEFSVPTHDSLMNPLLEALQFLGGSAGIAELNAKIVEIAGLTEEQMQVAHGNHRSEVEYRLAWTRTYLKIFGLIENSSRGVWSLTAVGKQTPLVDPKEVIRFVADQSRKQRLGRDASASENAELMETSENLDGSWQEKALDAVLKMSAGSFERLAQRLLRESGFVQVEVTGRSGDGGIDGNGILRLGGILSFHVSFQCKRWQGVIGPAVVREFRGAMMGRADKGLIITTSTFTKDAQKEATRDGAAAIDLVDGEQLVEMLKQLSLGIKTQRIEVEDVTVEPEWFMNI